MTLNKQGILTTAIKRQITSQVQDGPGVNNVKSLPAEQSKRHVVTICIHLSCSRINYCSTTDSTRQKRTFVSVPPLIGPIQISLPFPSCTCTLQTSQKPF